MSRRGTAEKKIAKSDPIYRNRLVNMLVNRILKHGKKSSIKKLEQLRKYIFGMEIERIQFEQVSNSKISWN